MGRRNLTQRRILLTGASSGIGRALALQLAPLHTHLLLVARREQPLLELTEELKARGAASAEPLVGDVTDARLRARAIAYANENWEGLDILVNNAGVSAHGRFLESKEETLRTIMAVNFFAAVELTRLAAPLLGESPNGVVVNIGSILGHRGVPHKNEYCASKFALRGWSEAVRPELARAGIDVLLVSPGTVETEFFDHLISKADSLPWGKQRGVPPEKVARQIVRAIQRGQREIYPNWRGRLLGLANRCFPGLVDRVMNRFG
ncbi:MAG: SDR family NAD(P)-dependent oxidoreductase [Pirellulales bacterium]|nr:SDR family NAD(P)-dependent oxidoreductase [Pirellulales bacterium]